MNQTQITQCPKCDTTFRVTPAQLKAAKGAVRCGACLHVFRASNHFIEEKKTISEPQDDRTQDLFDDDLFEEPVVKAKPDTTKHSMDDDGLIHDDMDEPGHDEFLIDDNNGLIDDDNGLFEDAPKTSSVINDFDEDFLSINPDEIEDPFFSDSEKLNDNVKENEDEDEAWAQALLDDTEDTQVSQPKEKPKPKPQISTVSQTEFTYIEDDPLDLSLPQKRNMAQIWGFGIASLLLVLALIGQMAFFNFDQWSRQAQYRPWYQLACAQLGCTLPSTFDLSKIKTTASPQVSTHPKFLNALMVDVLFINNAEYDQPFPRVELAFSDSNETIVARRIFKPDEYLAGEAAGLSLMPTQTPVHIALEIKDPGKSASNYQVRFLAP